MNDIEFYQIKFCFVAGMFMLMSQCDWNCVNVVFNGVKSARAKLLLGGPRQTWMAILDKSAFNIVVSELLRYKGQALDTLVWELHA